MAGALLSASTGAMSSVIAKLTNLLGDECNKFITGVKGEVRFLRDELSSMDALLQRLADMEEDQIDVQTEWRNKVRELAYDMEDCIDRSTHGLGRGDDGTAGFVRKMMRKIAMMWERSQIAGEIHELKARIVEENQRRDRHSIDQRIYVLQHVSLDPRVPTLYEEAKNLVGIDGPREENVGWLKDQGTKQLKVVSIFGLGGLGKTTLAMEVYRKMEEPFSCRASVSVSRSPDIKRIFKDILFQINRVEYDRTVNWETEQLTFTLREFLRDKRHVFAMHFCP